MSMASTTQIQPGWDVYGSDGDKIGDVAEIGPDYLLVTKGLIFVKDLYIPTSAVANVEESRVQLNVPKDQIDSMGWDQPPSGTWTSEAEGLPSSGGTSEQYAESDEAMATQTVGGGYDSYESRDASAGTVTDTDSTRVQRVEEELQAQKTAAETGEVVIGKEIIEEQQTLEVPVMREEVQIRSRTVDRPVTDAADVLGEGETVRIPVREEQVETTKEARVVEELEVQKVQHQDVERVTDTVRKEQLHVEEQGEGGLRRS